jgi:hypothetical protein
VEAGRQKEHTKDFNIRFFNNTPIPPDGNSKIDAIFSPKECGMRKTQIVLIVKSSLSTEKHVVSLQGEGEPPERFSFRAVSLRPEDDLAKKGMHYILSVSNKPYLAALAKAGVPVDWYLSIPSGTRQHTVRQGMRLKPGEVFLDSRASFLEEPALFNCFDLCATRTYWLTENHFSLSQTETSAECDLALPHVISSEHIPRCRHCLDPFKIKKAFLGEAPEQGEILELNGRNCLAIAVSSKTLTAFYRSCFANGCSARKDSRPALVVQAIQARPNDSSTSYCLLTESKGDYGRLLVSPYTLSLQCIKNTKNTGMRLNDSEWNYLVDLMFCYLGVENEDSTAQ